LKELKQNYLRQVAAHLDSMFFAKMSRKMASARIDMWYGCQIVQTMTIPPGWVALHSTGFDRALGWLLIVTGISKFLASALVVWGYLKVRRIRPPGAPRTETLINCREQTNSGREIESPNIRPTTA